MRQKLKELKGEVDKPIITARDCYTPLPAVGLVDRKPAQIQKNEHSHEPT